MGRRKIEIKAIKDDRNRSVTFLKRKGGLFKKAHELSVLCSVDVAVFIFGNNKKLYEYSSADMRELIHRYQYHGGPSEHKGPSDFNGGNDDDEDEEGDGTPPHGSEVVENQMMPPHPYAQHQPPFPQIRHHTPSASPPIGNGGGPFQAHPGHPIQRQHTPQPSIGSRPASRTDMRRMGPGMIQPPPPNGPPHPGMNYMPNPPIYNSPHPPGLMPQHGSHPPSHSQPQYAYHQQPGPMQQQAPYMDDRRSPMPSPMPPAYTSQPPSQGIQAPARPTPSPQPGQQHLPPSLSQMSPPPPQPERRLQDPPPPPPIEPKTEPQERPQPPLLNTDSAIKKLPQRKSHSIFTPIEENRSILSQHLASFTSESIKSESAAAAAAANAANAANRSQSVDVAALNRAADPAKSSPHLPQRASTQTDEKSRTVSLSSIPETTLTPPSRSNSTKAAGGPGGARPRGPRLTVQIPDGGSEGGGSARTAESNSPRNATETTTQPPQRHNSQSSLVLPPPSPSASAILSAGATGPPNPFARPPPQQNVNGETPVSALPSRFLTNELLPSPSSFYPDWNFRGGDSNTLPSPLNFATPVVGSGPSFLRDDTLNTTPNATLSALKDVKDTTSNANGSLGQNLSVGIGNSTATKRKTPEVGATAQSQAAEESEAKRVKVE
ncbi:probable RLM1 - transcription factor of the MADS box family [Fusarium torulosum]|uniref:MADS-box MEF2 type transcription factor MIG1 n=1 Tax=Fusarium torulosum TaxID=33205 RepID=A0AAE8M7F4_9HYPO|nr:probable RLM1 - transcription factor of the MADS box family [Fusarium torulosum]